MIIGNVTMSYYLMIMKTMLAFSGIAVILSGIILLCILISIRPQNRSKEKILIGAFRGCIEVIIGLWLIFIDPVFINIDISFILGISAIMALIISIFLRLYFFKNIRAMYSKQIAIIDPTKSPRKDT